MSGPPLDSRRKWWRIKTTNRVTENLSTDGNEVRSERSPGIHMEEKEINRRWSVSWKGDVTGARRKNREWTSETSADNKGEKDDKEM